ncbi:uncharacterized protein LOC116263917 isoform X2 [Nymphaea colorata]|uniref:uncharacterized protein LOC116263917 isoform X2 n=1 Tax=Nymphaea colorata TaxID=210225 RepID=UPI00129D9005|nr:uncharacterized protein LOC116263917 isoform X2 [Nymphaea colorata]
MAEVPRQLQSGGKESPVGDPCNFRRVEPPIVKRSTSDGSISLDVDDACDPPLPSNRRIQMQTSLSHKGWFPGGRKGQQQDEDDGWSKSHKESALNEKCPSVVVPLGVKEGSCQQSVMGERRVKRSRLPWLDSRKVFMIFASLSSVGTIMLIYFTLSINGHQAQD